MRKQHDTLSTPLKAVASRGFVHIFIDRPVLAWVINISIFLLGMVAYFYLSVRQYPQIQYPMITVLTQFEGANPEVMEMQVTRPLEERFASLEGLDLMTSESQAEQSKIRLRFKENRSLDAAAADVRDRLAQMESLPQGVTTPRITKADIDAGSVMSLVLSSNHHDVADLYDYASRSLKSNVEATLGVAAVELQGGAAYEMHIVLDPVKMGALGLTAAEVAEALPNQNFNKPAGRLGDADQKFLVTTKAKINRTEDFNNMPLFERKNYVVRVSDVGYAKLSKKDTRFRIRFNGKESVMLDVVAQSRANPIQISTDIRAKMKQLKENLPRGMVFEVAFDDSTFVRESINRVFRSIWEAIFLVFLVVLLFLRSPKVVLIPLVAIPISLAGAFFMAYLLGFSINILTLLALVLAVGLVVDDAIVVLENIYRHVEKGMKPVDAARLGAGEIQTSVIGMTITLLAVYTPITFATGLVGKLFTEFALMLAGAVLISGVVALVLSPVMCAYVLRTPAQEKNVHHYAVFALLYKLGNAFEAWLGRTTRHYAQSLRFALDRPWHVFVSVCVMGVMGYGVGGYLVPQELSPKEDQGLIKVLAQSPSGATLSYLDNHLLKADAVLAQTPEVQNRLVIEQVGEESFAKAMLLPRDKRRACSQIVPGVQKKLLENVSGVRAYAMCVNNSFGGESSRPFSIVVQTDRSHEELVKVVRRVRRLMDDHPGLRDVEWDLPQETQEFQIKLNRQAVAALNITPYAVARSLDVLIGGRRVSGFEKDSRVYPVKVMTEEWNKSSPNDLRRLMVKGRKEGKEIMVPLQDLVEIDTAFSNPAITHYGRMRAVRLFGAVAPGESLVGLYEKMKPLIRKELPPGFQISPSGTLQRYLNERSVTYLIFGLALVFIFLCMAAQFESFRDPFVILCSVPLALVGGIFTLWIVPGCSLNIYSQIGLITLIGLITKHGILLVDFINQKLQQGIAPVQAVIDSSQQRLRPILMTTFAMVLGSVPLVLGSGAGVEARRQVGWVILGGMTIGTLFTLFVIPVFYTLFSRRYAQARVEK